jgi:glutathione S-transferase
LKLYYAVDACSLSPHIALSEAGIDATLVKVDTKTHKLANGSDFYAINPKGYVPVLELDNGDDSPRARRSFNTSPIEIPPPPAGTMDRYRLQEWLNFISTELHKQFGPLFQQTTPAE